MRASCCTYNEMLIRRSKQRLASSILRLSDRFVYGEGFFLSDLQLSSNPQALTAYWRDGVDFPWTFCLLPNETPRPANHKRSIEIHNHSQSINFTSTAILESCRSQTGPANECIRHGGFVLGGASDPFHSYLCFRLAGFVASPSRR